MQPPSRFRRSPRWVSTGGFVHLRHSICVNPSRRISAQSISARAREGIITPGINIDHPDYMDGRKGPPVPGVSTTIAGWPETAPAWSGGHWLARYRRHARQVEHGIVRSGVERPRKRETMVRIHHSPPWNVAQLVEQLIGNQWVAGSNPADPTARSQAVPRREGFPASVAPRGATTGGSSACGIARVAAPDRAAAPGGPPAQAQGRPAWPAARDGRPRPA